MHPCEIEPVFGVSPTDHVILSCFAFFYYYLTHSMMLMFTCLQMHNFSDAAFSCVRMEDDFFSTNLSLVFR